MKNTYKLAGTNCRLSEETAFDVGSDYLERRCQSLDCLTTGLRHPVDVTDVKWALGLLDWFDRAERLYRRLHKRPMAHKRTDA